MSSNFFTRPFGLHPTPQICFPPPLPPPVGNKTWFLTMLDPYPIAPNIPGFTIGGNDPLSAPGAPIGYGIAMPACLNVPPFTFPNGGTATGTIAALGPPGAYVAVLDIHWPDGSISHGTRPFVIL